jgi:translation initiation factor IF-3
MGANGQQIGIVSIEEALKTAKEQELDLVELRSNANPPICKILNYGKFIFEQNKKKSLSKKKQKKINIKEIKLRPGIDMGDYNIKLRNIIKFLNNGDKVKITIHFRGREIIHQKLGVNIIKRLENHLINYCSINHQPKIEGKQMSVILEQKNKISKNKDIK